MKIKLKIFYKGMVNSDHSI